MFEKWRFRSLKLMGQDQRMDFILMDIKNFLKKLENGQLEIEAGQWELHRDITNMRKMVNELKNLKEELGKVRISSLQQMGLIRELQDKFDVFRTNKSEEPSMNESAFGSGKVSKDPSHREGAEEEFDGNKSRRFRSNEILEIASQNSKAKSNADSDLGLLEPQGMDEQDLALAMDRIENSSSETTGNSSESKRRKSMSKSPSSPQYATTPSSTNQDILQRYLQDSARYLGQKTSGSIDMSLKPSNSTADEAPNYDCDDCSSVAPVDSEGEESHESKTKESSLWKGKAERVSRTYPKSSKKCSHRTLGEKHGRRQRNSEKTIYCKTCGKDFSNRSRLKKHAICHWMSSTSPKGFKCCYCKKICPTPEKLTQHLRKCRIITKSYNRME